MNTFVFRAIYLAIMFLGFSLPAQAFNFKPYAGVGLGDFIIDAGLGSKAAFGGYGILGGDFNQNVGVELRVGSTGSTTGTVMVPQGFPDGGITLVPTPAKIGVDWFVSYLLKLQYPFANNFRIYGLLGGTTLKSKFTFTGKTDYKTNTTLSYGGGIDYNLGNQWLVGVDGMIYSNKANTNPGANYQGLDVWAFTGTVKYAF